MYRFHFIFCVLLVCGLDLVTANIIEFIKNFPSKLWGGMKDSWTSIKENTIRGITTPFSSDVSVVDPTRDFGEDYMKIPPMVRRRHNQNKLHRERNFDDLRRSNSNDNGFKPVIKIPYLKNPLEKYAFALKNNPEFLVITQKPKLKIFNRRPLPFRRSESEENYEERFTSQPSDPTKMIIFRNSAVKNPSYMDESDVIIKFDKFQIIINSTSKLLDKKP